MTRAVLSVLLFSLLPLPESAIAQVPEAQEVPAEAPTSVSLSRSAVMEVPAGQDVRRIAPDGAVVTSRWESGEVTFTLHDPKGGSSTRLPFSPAVQKSEYRSVTEVRVDGPYVSFADVRDPDIAIYNRQTQEVRRLTHPEGGITFRVSVSPETGEVLYERRSGPTTQSRVYLWRKGTDRPVLIEEAAMSPKWAPNGNFFLLKRRTSVQDTSAVDEAPLYWWLYDQKGNPILDMGRYGRASGFEDWSPDSRKIALDPAFGRPGFYIVYLRGDGRSVEIERARYVAAPDGQALGTPKWSPDGTKLAFTASFYGDQTGERKELRILADGSYRRYSAGRGSAYSLDPWEWGSPTVLYARGAGTPAAQPGEKRPFIDLDDDGTTDFSFQRPNSGHAEWFEDGQRISKSLVANLVIPEDKNRILKVKDGYLAALEKGEIVGKRVPDSLKWASQASTLYDALTYTSPESTSVVWRGPWPGKKIRYLGLKLVRRGSSYYGWARVRVDTSEAREGPATVHDYAYNPHQGQPIRAGCKP